MGSLFSLLSSLFSLLPSLFSLLSSSSSIFRFFFFFFFFSSVEGSSSIVAVSSSTSSSSCSAFFFFFFFFFSPLSTSIDSSSAAGSDFTGSGSSCLVFLAGGAFSSALTSLYLARASAILPTSPQAPTALPSLLVTPSMYESGVFSFGFPYSSKRPAFIMAFLSDAFGPMPHLRG